MFAKFSPLFLFCRNVRPGLRNGLVVKFGRYWTGLATFYHGLRRPAASPAHLNMKIKTFITSHAYQANTSRPIVTFRTA
jgi:hypothetical protein